MKKIVFLVLFLPLLSTADEVVCTQESFEISSIENKKEASSGEIFQNSDGLWEVWINNAGALNDQFELKNQAAFALCQAKKQLEDSHVEK